MKEYIFKAKDSNSKEYIVKIKDYNYFLAREQAQQRCYKMGLCFLGSF